MDYVVNGMIEDADPDFDFVDRPTVEPLIDPKYSGWSFIRVLKDLLKQQEENPQPQDGEGGAENGHQTLDQHIQSSRTSDAEKEISRQIDDAMHQGKVMQSRIAGEKTTGGALDGAMRKRDTNWKQYLRDFLTEICEGDEQSRFSPPNKRLLASGFIMPSHFSESTGEIVVACDTSGSMAGLYPTVFGEIARICENVLPDSVRVLWWEYEVVGDQQFKPIDYPNIGKTLKPVGGGGTRLSSVAEYITNKKYKPKAVVILTDGYIETDYTLPEVPVLFGVCDNDHFTGARGKTVRIYS
jgi:predicted metal-dependent peptidase